MIQTASPKARLRPKPRALVVDDNADIRYTILSILAFDGISGVPADSFGAALQQIALHEPQLCICDIFMPQAGGLQLIATLRHQGYAGRILAISGGGHHRSFTVLQAARILGADATLRKPFEVNQLRGLVGSLLDAGEADPRLELARTR